MELSVLLILGFDASGDVSWMRLLECLVLPGASTPSVTKATAVAAVITTFAEANRPAGQALQISILMAIWTKSWPCQSSPCRFHQSGQSNAEYIHGPLMHVHFRLAQKHERKCSPGSEARAGVAKPQINILSLVLRNMPDEIWMTCPSNIPG